MFKGEVDKSFEDLKSIETGLKTDHMSEIERMTDLLNSLADQDPRLRRATYRKIAGIANSINGGNVSPKEIRQTMRALSLPTPKIGK